MLSVAQVMYVMLGVAADPWMTPVGYFNALRELGGMRRMLDDEVVNRVRRADRGGMAVRYLNDNDVVELTSRVTSRRLAWHCSVGAPRYRSTSPTARLPPRCCTRIPPLRQAGESNPYTSAIAPRQS